MEFISPKQLIVGKNAFGQIAPMCKKWGSHKPFILYSGSALRNKIERFLDELQKNECEPTFFEVPKGEPTLTHLTEAMIAFQTANADGVIGIGGGSAMDLAKAVAVMAKNPTYKFSELADYEALNRYPLILVPTTAGTGSEATKVSVLIDEEKHMKYNPGHADLVSDVAILDATLTLNIPPAVTAFTGLDALTHAIEAYVSNKASELSDFYAIQAIQKITSALETTYMEPSNANARETMLVGSYYAGLAFSNASTNLAHAMGRALGAWWNLPHGQSVAVVHPFVIGFTLDACKDRYDEIAKAMGLRDGAEVQPYLMNLNERLQVWDSIAFVGNEDFAESIPTLTKNALSGNGILTNRKIPTEKEIQQLFEQLHNHIKRHTLLKH